MASKPVPASSAPYALGRALLPLRAFLGFTFCFAGLQKLANPRFFDAADPASIQSQLAGAARRSPIHTLIAPLAHVAVPLGVLIAFGELAVGVGTLPYRRHRQARPDTNLEGGSSLPRGSVAVRPKDPYSWDLGPWPVPLIRASVGCGTRLHGGTARHCQATCGPVQRSAR